jgi:hypothetical protein
VGEGCHGWGDRLEREFINAIMPAWAFTANLFLVLFMPAFFSFYYRRSGWLA